MTEEGAYESDNSRVNVFVRLRPGKPKEEKATRQAGEKAVRISVTRKSEKTFVYDKLFGEKDGQQTLYDVAGRPVIQDVLKGYNGCIMAYGQTGAGKTHSLLNMSSGTGGGGGEVGVLFCYLKPPRESTHTWTRPRR